MKVKKINKSSKQTDEIIKQAFAEILSQKHELNNITVTDLIKKAGISRASFYTHYESINDLTSTLFQETVDVLLNDLTKFNNLDDIYNYIDNIIKILKKNEKFYKLILSSNDALLYLSKIIDILNSKLLEYYSVNKEMNINFYTYGCFLLIVQYFKDDKYNLDEISNFMKKSISNLI